MATEEPTQKGPKKACAYFLRCGSCSFGDSCRFHHPFERLPEFKFNSRGLPLRAGEPECDFWLKHGCCSFGRACKFTHPELPRNWKAPNSPIPVPVVAVKAQAADSKGRNQRGVRPRSVNTAVSHAAASWPLSVAPQHAPMHTAPTSPFGTPYTLPMSPMQMPIYASPFGSAAAPGMMGVFAFGNMPRQHPNAMQFAPNGQWLPYPCLVHSMSSESLQLPRQYMWGNPPVQRTFSGNAINNRSSSHLRPMSSMQSSSDGADSDSVGVQMKGVHINGTRDTQLSSATSSPALEGGPGGHQVGTGWFRPVIQPAAQARRHGRKGAGVCTQTAGPASPSPTSSTAMPCKLTAAASAQPSDAADDDAGHDKENSL